MSEKPLSNTDRKDRSIRLWGGATRDLRITLFTRFDVLVYGLMGLVLCFAPTKFDELI